MQLKQGRKVTPLIYYSLSPFTFFSTYQILFRIFNQFFKIYSGMLFKLFLVVFVYYKNYRLKQQNKLDAVLSSTQTKILNATVALTQRADNKLVVQIIDDRVGFDVVKAKQKEGLGLSHIEARIKMLNGRFVINSEIGEDSEISLVVPIKFKTELDN